MTRIERRSMQLSDAEQLVALVVGDAPVYGNRYAFTYRVRVKEGEAHQGADAEEAPRRGRGRPPRLLPGRPAWGPWHPRIRWDDLEGAPFVHLYDTKGRWKESRPAARKTLEEVVGLLRIFGRRITDLDVEKL